ncbi:two-component system alkaline phosphatase synthesis response regulator PhoP [Enterococcus sp. PF1-24]|uniref:response regulator transcription factor n=1 Tax=unclassified Enterococcus TaxID=2608891 RepID=UPI00247520AA|nr:MULTISPECIES: response regulator transcription factor [unclassified Enterococcus]MDH6364154.1 two-component system alkaline phosphatase synthesis response regulator PhoP [Enterococcus sp. PFB1-1]MDH6401255.1 two-component system alkaline phosphatase synthesis response regulator PhoP [Enterococcus sp. PF1-24]
MKHVLVVDDEPSILTLLTFNLEKAGYQVTTAEDGKLAYQLAMEKSFDFIILDLMLPSMDGLDITRHLRQEKIDTPILILTAKDEQIDRILGLEMGADDYLAKPFSPREVLARMKAIFRRMEPRQEKTPAPTVTEESEDEWLQVGEIQANLINYQALVNNQEIMLTPKEFELLVYFMKRKNRVINRETLLQRVWQFDFSGQSRIVDVHISNLREKIEVDPKHPQYLQTVRGFGYRFQEPK